MPGKNFDDASIRRIARSVLYTEGVRQNPQTRRRRYVTAATPEIRLGQLTNSLSPGGSCLVQWLILDGGVFLNADADPVEAWDRLDAMTGTAGDKCYFTWNRQAGEFWILQKSCSPEPSPVPFTAQARLVRRRRLSAPPPPPVRR